MRRVLLAAAALAIPVSAVTMVAVSPALAGGSEKSITCTTFTGTVTGTSTVSGCNGNTGGGSQPLSSSALATGGTVTWLNGDTTTIGTPTTKAVSAKKCPVSGSLADSFKATVTADTTGLKKLGTASGEVCISPTGAISALKPLKVT